MSGLRALFTRRLSYSALLAVLIFSIHLSANRVYAVPTVFASGLTGDFFSPGGSFTIDIGLAFNDGGPVAAYGFRAFFDPRYVQLVGVSDLELGGGNQPIMGPPEGGGNRGWRDFGTLGNYNNEESDLMLCRLVFQVVAPAPPSYLVRIGPDPQNAALVNKKWQAIPHVYDNNAIRDLLGEPPMEEPTPFPDPLASPFPGGGGDTYIDDETGGGDTPTGYQPGPGKIYRDPRAVTVGVSGAMESEDGGPMGVVGDSMRGPKYYQEQTINNMLPGGGYGMPGMGAGGAVPVGTADTASAPKAGTSNSADSSSPKDDTNSTKSTTVAALGTGGGAVAVAQPKLRTVTISGSVKTALGRPKADAVVVAGAGVAKATTNTSGSYTLTVPYGWSGKVSASLEGYQITPPFREYIKVTVNRGNENFTATPFSDNVSDYYHVTLRRKNKVTTSVVTFIAGGITIFNGAPDDALRIRLKKQHRGLAVPPIKSILTDSGFQRIYTQGDIEKINASGALGKVSTRGAMIRSIQCAQISALRVWNGRGADQEALPRVMIRTTRAESGAPIKTRFVGARLGQTDTKQKVEVYARPEKKPRSGEKEKLPPKPTPSAATGGNKALAGPEKLEPPKEPVQKE